MEKHRLVDGGVSSGGNGGLARVRSSGGVRSGLDLELQRLDALLARHLAGLRQRGRTPLGELVAGAVIEDGEAEGLLSELRAAHGSDGAPSPAPAIEDAAGTLPALELTKALYGLDAFERDVLLLGLAIEIDSRYGRLIAFLNDHAERVRPTLGLAAALFGRGGRLDALESFLPKAPLTRFGLVEVDGDGPFAGRPFRLAESFWPRLVERPVPIELARLSTDARPLDELVLPAETRAQLHGYVRWVLGDRARWARTLLVVRGPAGSGREAVAAAVARELGGAALIVSAEQLERPEHHAPLRREARWNQAAVVIAAGPGGVAPGAPAFLTTLEGPASWICGDGSTEALARASGREAFELRLAEPGYEVRLRLWDRLLPEGQRGPDVDLPLLASQFRFGLGRIEAAATLALARSRATGGGEAPSGALLHEVCATLPAGGLSALAQRLSCTFTRNDLVVPPETLRELDLAAAWARHRGRVFSDWGASRGLVGGRGLACLFCGPPGTGKTMGAQVLAREVGLDVYRIDLSQVVSKYIGETEKNLARVFDEAYAANAILFFDEADALFGKRSEVKDAHDRYANIETAFLLQRIESHDGITILATNLRRNMDDAFLRRLHVVADFPLPGEKERRLIWERHLPRPELRGRDLDLDLVARRFTVSGGEIRNAVVTAAFLGADEGQALSMRHLVIGLWREMRKGGRMLDPSEFGPWAPVVIALASGSTARA